MSLNVTLCGWYASICWWCEPFTVLSTFTSIGPHGTGVTQLGHQGDTWFTVSEQQGRVAKCMWSGDSAVSFPFGCNHDKPWEICFWVCIFSDTFGTRDILLTCCTELRSVWIMKHVACCVLVPKGNGVKSISICLKLALDQSDFESTLDKKTKEAFLWVECNNKT